MNKFRKSFRTKITKQLISGIVHARACLKFFWVKKRPHGGHGKKSVPFVPPQKCPKIHINSCSSLFLAILESLESRHSKKLFLARLASSLPPQKVSIICVKKCAWEKYFCQVFHFGTHIALYVKCSKMRLYISRI